MRPRLFPERATLTLHKGGRRLSSPPQSSTGPNFARHRRACTPVHRATATRLFPAMTRFTSALGQPDGAVRCRRYRFNFRFCWRRAGAAAAIVPAAASCLPCHGKCPCGRLCPPIELFRRRHGYALSAALLISVRVRLRALGVTARRLHAKASTGHVATR